MTNPVPIAQRPWRTWYNSAHWRRRRALQLRQHPLCVMCLAHGVTTPATIADHVVSHRGDWNAFILGELQSLCEPCHNRGKRLLDERGFSIQLKKGVAKYHWQVFAPGAKEPCQQHRDETKSSISVQCQRPKAADKAAH